MRRAANDTAGRAEGQRPLGSIEVQTWHEGRNIMRYVPRNQVDELCAATDGDTRFMALAEQYADEIIRITRHQ